MFVKGEGDVEKRARDGIGIER
jgi:hypothetical protein